jgi:hypothetical protein
MKNLSNEVFRRIRKYVYLYGRHLDVARWRFHFEGGSAEDVAEALAFYQNEDGGFGHGIELDCQNPNSQPVQFFWGANEILAEIGADAPGGPMMKRFIKYIETCPDITERGIRFVIPSNNDYPCNFWYLYDPDKTPAECNINSGVGFVFEHFAPDAAIYQKARRIVEYRLSVMEDILKTRLESDKNEWQGIEPSDYASLILELKKHHIKTAQECRALYDSLLDIVKTYGTAHTYDAIAKQIGDDTSDSRMDDISEPEALDALIDKLSGDNQSWNNYGRLLNGEDNAQKYAQMYNIGMWWAIKDAIRDLKILKTYGRIEQYITGGTT